MRQPPSMRRKTISKDAKPVSTPSQPIRKFFRAEHEMQNPARTAAGGLRRGVQQQRSHEQRVASLGRHDSSRMPPCQGCLGRTYAPGFMGARHDTKRTVLGSTGVHMDSHGEHLPENLVRCVDENRTFLLAPSREGGVSDAAQDRNAQVLVDRHEPVLGRGLLEQCALDSPGTRRQGFAHLRMSQHLAGKIRAPAFAQHPPCPGAGHVERLQVPRNLSAFRIAQQVANKHEAVRGEWHIQFGYSASTKVTDVRRYLVPDDAFRLGNGRVGWVDVIGVNVVVSARPIPTALRLQSGSLPGSG